MAAEAHVGAAGFIFVVDPFVGAGVRETGSVYVGGDVGWGYPFCWVGYDGVD